MWLEIPFMIQTKHKTSIWGFLFLNKFREVVGLDFEERTETRLNDHAQRIRALETADAAMAVRMENLCEKLDSLTNWIKALIVALITSTGGFFIWYVQTLPR